jgi:hypothetical protein
VYLFEVATRREHNISDNPFRDSNPAITPDGRHVVFASNRDGTNHLYVVPLTRITEDPDDPLVRARLARAAGADARHDCGRTGAARSASRRTASAGARASSRAAPTPPARSSCHATAAPSTSPAATTTGRACSPSASTAATGAASRPAASPA